MAQRPYKPLDLNLLKQTVTKESARLNLRSWSAEGESAFTLSLALSAAMKKIFFEKSEGTFSSEPDILKLPITQFNHRMRVDAMEKFNMTTVFSAIQLGVNEDYLQRQDYLVTLVAYVQQPFLPELLRLLKYPYFESDDDAQATDGCGTLVNLLAGQFKREMAQLGYRDLMMSPFQAFINTVPEGIGIPRGVNDKYELSFEIDGAKRLVLELVTLEMLPKWKTTDKKARKRILIIDDDPTFTKTIDPFLQSQGFEVIFASNGREGLSKLKESPHLIILDVLMPVMDGYEFVLEKKKLPYARHIPIIVLTAKDGLAEKFKIEGAREYLLKPFRPSALLNSIQRCIW